MTRAIRHLGALVVLAGVGCSDSPGAPDAGAAPAVSSLAIEPASPRIEIGATAQLTAHGTLTDGSREDMSDRVTWSSADDPIAEVSGQGIVTGIGVGEAQLRAEVGGVSAAAPVTVTEATLTSLRLEPEDPQLALGTATTLTAIGERADGSFEDVSDQVTWTSADDAIATVSSEGVVVAHEPGDAEIRAETSGVATGVEVTVTDAALEALTLDPPTSEVVIGAQLKLRVTGTFSDGSTQDVSDLPLTFPLSWSSDDEAIAEVSELGVVTPRATGSVTIEVERDGIAGEASIEGIAWTQRELGSGPFELANIVIEDAPDDDANLIHVGYASNVANGRRAGYCEILQDASGASGVCGDIAPDGTGEGVSLALDPQGTPHITHLVDVGSGDADYHFSTHAAEPPWPTEAIAAAPGSFESTSLAFTPEGEPAMFARGVLYRQATSGWDEDEVPVECRGPLRIDAGGVPHLACVEVAVDPTLFYLHKAGGDWNVEEIDKVSGTFARFAGVSIELDSSGSPHLSYFRLTDHEAQLNHLERGEGEWITSPVIVLPRRIDGRYKVALALDADDRPHLAYTVPHLMPDLDAGTSSTDYEIRTSHEDAGAWTMTVLDYYPFTIRGIARAFDPGGAPGVAFITDELRYMHP